MSLPPPPRHNGLCPLPPAPSPRQAVPAPCAARLTCGGGAPSSTCKELLQVASLALPPQVLPQGLETCRAIRPIPGSENKTFALASNRGHRWQAQVLQIYVTRHVCVSICRVCFHVTLCIESFSVACSQSFSVSYATCWHCSVRFKHHGQVGARCGMLGKQPRGT